MRQDVHVRLAARARARARVAAVRGEAPQHALGLAPNLPRLALNLADQRRERGRLPAPARPRQQQRIRVPDGADVRVKLVDDVPSRNAPGAVLLHRDDVQVSLQLRGRPVGREIGHGERVHARLRPSLRRRRAADAPGMMRHRIPGVIEMPRPGP